MQNPPSSIVVPSLSSLLLKEAGRGDGEMARYGGHGKLKPEINASDINRKNTHIHIKQTYINDASFYS